MTRFFIACPTPAAPSGGIYMLYQMARLLRGLGHEATVVQTGVPFEPYWFNHYPDEALDTREPVSAGLGDVVIIPEVQWPQPPRIHIAEGARRILFCQNYIWLDQRIYAADPGETIVCSRFLWNWMQREFGANVIGKMTPFLDAEFWAPTPKTLNRVLVMGRRNPYHELVAQNLAEDGFTVDYVTEPLTQSQLYEHLKSCEFYVHLVHPEGFPMAALEAMRSGTIVVGTTGGGGNEFMFHKETAYCVQDPENGHYGSRQIFIERILEGMRELRADAGMRSRIWTSAYTWSQRYSAQATQAELKAMFG